MEIHHAARKHGIDDLSIWHALDRALFVGDVDDDEPEERTLVLGPSPAGNMLELVVLHLDDGRDLVIHAMLMRRRYRHLLPRPDRPTP